MTKREYKTGDVVLIPFPFSDFSEVKVRPAIVVYVTLDKYSDVVLSAISSVVPLQISINEFMVTPDCFNNLRKTSIVKVDRLVTIKSENIIQSIGLLSETGLRFSGKNSEIYFFM